MPPRRNGRKRQQQQEPEISPESSARPSPSLYPSPLPDYDEDEFVNQQTPAIHSKPPPRPVSPLPASSPQRPQTPLIDFEEAYAAEEQNSEAEAEEVGQQRTPVLARYVASLVIPFHHCTPKYPAVIQGLMNLYCP